MTVDNGNMGSILHHRNNILDKNVLLSLTYIDIIIFAMKMIRKQRNIPKTHNILTTVFVS